MTDPAEPWDGLSTEAQRQASEAAGRLDLDRALGRRSAGERAAFRKAIDLYYAHKPHPAQAPPEEGDEAAGPIP